MKSEDDKSVHLNYLDFELEIGVGKGREYPIAVLRSPAGEAREMMYFPYDELALENRLKDVQIALLRSGGKRRKILSAEEQTVHNFGRDLFNALISGEVRSRYDVSMREATQQGKGLRLKLRIQSPELAALPWEFLYDSRQAEFLCLSTDTPVVRYLELPQPIQPLTVTLPLQILGMVASPQDQTPLNVQREKQRMENAIRDLQVRGLVNLEWLPGQTWRDLRHAMWKGPWHVFHFIGHGDFDSSADEGIIALVNEVGKTTHPLRATQLGRLLAGHRSLRLVLLNSCEGARGGKHDIFSSTAAILVQRGIPAVLAMQYEITDRAAIEFARTFYEAVANGMPIDAAALEGRLAISIGVANTVEWGTPVLYMRSSDGTLFSLKDIPIPPPSTTASADRKESSPRAPTVLAKNKLGVEVTVEVKEFGVGSRVLKYLLGPRRRKKKSLRKLPLMVDNRIFMLIPWGVFERAYQHEGDHIVVLTNKQEIRGKIVGDIVTFEGKKYAMKDVVDLVLTGLPEREYIIESSKHEPTTLWQLSAIEPVNPTYSGYNPRFAFQFRGSSPAGYFTSAADTDSFYIKLAEGEEVLAYFDHFREISFDRSKSDQLRVTTEQGIDTVGSLLLKTEYTTFISKKQVPVKGSYGFLVMDWADFAEIEIALDAPKYVLRKISE